MEVFESLLALARAALREHPDMEQAVVLQTAGGTTHTLLNRNVMAGDYRQEDEFLKNFLRQKDTHVCRLVCMWQGGCVDLPSRHLRDGLLEINGNCKDTRILLQGELGYMAKPLRVTIPGL